MDRLLLVLAVFVDNPQFIYIQACAVYLGAIYMKLEEQEGK